MPPLRSTRGQASVELVALLPLLALIALALWQGVVAAQAAWLAGGAARAAARAQAVGDDPRAAARAAVPDYLRAGVSVAADRSTEVRIRVVIPSVVGGLRLGTVAASAHLQSQARAPGEAAT